MTHDNYRLALQTAREELQEVINTQNALHRRAAELKKSIEVLSTLCEENPEAADTTAEFLEMALLPEFGISTGIRTILKEADDHGLILSATDIRDTLAKRKFDLSGYVNEMAVIHNTLNRLEKQGEIEPRLTGWTLTDKGRQEASSIGALTKPRSAFYGG